jgi:hypothetical protein
MARQRRPSTGAGDAIRAGRRCIAVAVDVVTSIVRAVVRTTAEIHGGAPEGHQSVSRMGSPSAW